MRYLHAEEILAIHDRLVEETGGLLGIRDVNLLYSIAERPKTGMMNREFFPDLFTKAAVYLEALATFHVFSDGNKRTAFLTVGAFLGLNGHDLSVSDVVAYRMVMAVAQKKKSLDQIAVWLKKHSHRYF